MDVGQQVGGRYRLEEQLASERQLTIYRALDEQSGKPVVLHVYPRQSFWQGSPGLDLGRRVPELIEQLADLSHPHLVCPQHSLALNEDDVAVVYPWVEGQRLDQRLAVGPLMPEQALPIATDLSSALEALHARGLVHRDIKPRNVLLTDRGAVLTGLEWAQMPSDLVASGPREQHPGSPAYMSPEQAGTGSPLDARSDIYSLGLVLRAALSGEARDVLAGGHGALGAVVKRALQPDPSRRYQSACELEDDLALLAGGSIVDRMRLHLRRLPRGAWALGSLGVVALVWVLLGSGAPDNTGGRAITQQADRGRAPIAWVVEPERVWAAGDSLPAGAAAAAQPPPLAETGVDATRFVELRAGQFIERAFLTADEVHRATVRVSGGRGYMIATANLAAGVDTILEIWYDGQWSSNDDAWPGTLASSVFVMPPKDTTLSVQVANRGVVGENATYELLIVQADPTPTPTSQPTEVVAREREVTMTPRPTYTPGSVATSTRMPTRTPRPTSTRRPTYTPRPTGSPTLSLTPTQAPTVRPTATATPPRTVLPIKTVATPVW